MINPAEIRLGNTIYRYVRHKLTNATEIMHSNGTYQCIGSPIVSREWEEIQIDAVQLKLILQDYEFARTIYRYIELSDERLLKLGFRKVQNTYHYNDVTHELHIVSTRGQYYPVLVQLPELSHETQQMIGLRMITYQHELENLFFVIFGKELKTIKSSKQ